MLVLANDLLTRSPLGSGLVSPPTLNAATNDLDTVSDLANVQACIVDLVTTQVGERIGNEDLGTNLPQALFEPVDGILDVASIMVVQAIQQFEPRVKNVNATAEEITDNNGNGVKLTVTYTVRSTGAQGSASISNYFNPTGGGSSGWQ